MASVVEEDSVAEFIEGNPRGFNLFTPSRKEAIPKRAILFLHGFTRDRTRHRALAARLAAGLNASVLVPDLPSLFWRSLLGAEKAQSHCIREAVAAAGWLVNRLKTSKESNERSETNEAVTLIIGGYSAGGAIAFEAARDLQQTGIAPHALLLIDAVPWPRTKKVAQSIATLPGGILLLQSESSNFNLTGAFRKDVLEEYPLDTIPEARRHIPPAILVCGSNHLDAENAGSGQPNDDDRQNSNSLLLRLMIGKPQIQHQETYYALSVAWLQDAFENDGNVANPGDTFMPVLDEHVRTKAAQVFPMQ
eukprot:TRINITY_DN16695_c3_g1_i2.p1 TRINITY_DN16695_c3_g1~~TRINITY_DN16695_c3_g1_i2.p1  ORF type:complete len:333 (+),score=58.73 TRINITY_DN16695_c3_g1_i2:82-999(+)